MTGHATPHVVFVCWGNICRSPMAERAAQAMAREQGVKVEFSSAATTAEETGNPMDRRAAQALQRAGYRSDGHRAHQITASEIRSADLVVAMEPVHLRQMRRIVPDAANLALITDFDPAAPGTGIEDPWYGPASGFDATLAQIERALPGVLDWVRQRAPATTPGPSAT